MSTINRDQLLQQLQWRYATKQFDPQRKISPADWAALEESLLLSPSSYGLQPWKIVIVTDPALRAKLVPVSWGQKQIVDASHLVVFAVKKKLGEQDIEEYLDHIAEVRGVPRESLDDFRGMLLGGIIKGMDPAARRAWATRQAYIALGNFLNSAALLGIDACPMEGFQADKYDEILHLDQQGLAAAVIATAGYRIASDPYAALKKVRFPKEQVLVEL
jgi:nitroreductase